MKGRWRKKREKGERLARTTTIFDYAVTLFDHGKSIINMLLKHTRPQDSVKDSFEITSSHEWNKKSEVKLVLVEPKCF